MNHETAVWTLLACLLAAAVIGFAVAWTIQFWRMREGARLAADLEEAHHRLQAAHQHLVVAAEHERTARVQADHRTRDLNEQLLAVQGQLDAAAQHHQRQLTSLQDALDHLQQERAHLQQAAHEAAQQAALANAEQIALRQQLHEASQQLETSSAARAAADAQARLDALGAEHAEGQRELLQLRTRLGEASNRTLELEHTINRMQLEALGQAQAHAQALATAQAAVSRPAAADAEELRIAQRLDAQRVQELEDQLRRSRQLASDYKLEAGSLKARVADLELRLNQLFDAQPAAIAATKAD